MHQNASGSLTSIQNVKVLVESAIFDYNYENHLAVSRCW